MRNGKVEEENIQNKFVLKLENIEDLLTKELSIYLINQQSSKLFKRLGINTIFMEINPTEWKNNTCYQTGKNLIGALHIINDIAERYVKLMGEYNKK